MAIKDYKTLSLEKLSANAAKIPKAWKLPSKYLENVNANSHLSVLDVPRICGILSEEEIDITENYDATSLLEKIASRQFSSYDVVLAFCKRAAIAHQLVRYKLVHTYISINPLRSIALQKSCLKMLLLVQRLVMNTSHPKEPSWVLFMVCQSASKTRSTSRATRQSWDLLC